MIKKIKENTANWNINDWIVLYLVFISTFNIKYAPIGIVALLLSTIFLKRNSEFNIKNVVDFKKPLIWMVIFYFLHFVGFLWTSNMSFAWSDVGMKASFIIFPLIVSIGKFNLTLTTFLKSIVISLCITVVLLLLFAVYQSFHYEEDNHWGYFFESEFSCLMHRSYFATYTAIGANIAIIHVLTLKPIKWNLAASILLFTATILTLSKAGLILIICSFTIISFWILFKQKNWKISAAILSALCLIVLFFSFSTSSISSRIQEIPKALKSVKTENNQSTESNTARIIMWSTSSKIINENILWGVGTGDVKDKLVEKNQSLNNLGVADSRLNAHNQFLNTWVQIGIFGFISLIMVFITLFRIAISEKNMLYFLIIFNFFISFLFESFVETQAGIIPFCMVITLLSTLKYNRFKIDSNR